jgi:hypothetical protein
MSQVIQEIGVVTLQLMKIPQIGEPLVWFYDRKMDIQISTWLLGRPNHSYQLLYSAINPRVFFSLKKTTSALYPFGNT